MSRHTRVNGLAAVLLAAMAAVACGGGGEDGPAATPPAVSDPAPSVRTRDAGSPAPDATPTLAAEATRFGVAGLIPPNYPDATSDDWQALFEGFADTGELAGVYQDWSENPGGVPEPVAVVYQVTAGKGLEVVVGIGAKRDLPGGGVEPTLDYHDPARRQQFIETILAVVRQYDVAYLLVDTEVNRLWMADPAAFDGFVALYGEVYDVVKAESPETKVFTGFQYEMLRGDAFLAGGSDTREPQWELVDRFAGKLDLLGLTSYPYFDYGDPAEIPADYYSEAAERYGLPLAITELGWPSRPLRTAPDSAYGGTEAEQAAFVQRFGELIAGVPVEMVLWAFPHDAGQAVPVAFESVSLRANDGSPKPALREWQLLAGVD